MTIINGIAYCFVPVQMLVEKFIFSLVLFVSVLIVRLTERLLEAGVIHIIWMSWRELNYFRLP